MAVADIQCCSGRCPLPGSAREISGDDVGSVPVGAAAGPLWRMVVRRIGVRGGLPAHRRVVPLRQARRTDLSTAESRTSLHVALPSVEASRAGSARTPLSPAQRVGGPPGLAARAAFAESGSEVAEAPVQDAGGYRAGDGDVVAGGTQRHPDQGQAVLGRLEEQAVAGRQGVAGLDPGRAGVDTDQRVGVLPGVAVVAAPAGSE